MEKRETNKLTEKHHGMYSLCLHVGSKCEEKEPRVCHFKMAVVITFNLFGPTPALLLLWNGASAPQDFRCYSLICPGLSFRAYWCCCYLDIFSMRNVQSPVLYVTVHIYVVSLHSVQNISQLSPVNPHSKPQR